MSVVLNAALNVQRPLKSVESFSSRLNERRTEKQLNSLSANENRCGFANYVSRTSMSHYCHPHLTSSFLSFPPLYRPLSLFSSISSSSSPSSLSSSSVKVSQRVLLLEHALFRQTFRAEARNFSFPPLLSRHSLLFRRVSTLSVAVTIAVSPQAAGQNSIQIHSVKLKLCRSRFSEAKFFNRKIKNGLLSPSIFEFPSKSKDNNDSMTTIQLINIAKLIASMLRKIVEESLIIEYSMFLPSIKIANKFRK